MAGALARLGIGPRRVQVICQVPEALRGSGFAPFGSWYDQEIKARLCTFCPLFLGDRRIVGSSPNRIR